MRWIKAILKARKTAKLRRMILLGENTTLHHPPQRHAPGSHIAVGDDCVIEGILLTERAESRLILGNNIYLGGHSTINCAQAITVGDNVLISYQCLLMDSDNHSLRYSVRKDDLQRWRAGQHDWRPVSMAPIMIGQGVWLGARVIVLKGVSIGEGSIIGAGSVVTKDIPDWSIAVGNPTRVIRTIPPEER